MTEKIIEWLEVNVLIQKYLNGYECGNFTYDVEKYSNVQIGYLGEHYMLKVNLKGNQEIRFFVKYFPDRMDYVKEVKCFEKEILMYEKLLPKLQENVSIFTPKCFYTRNFNLIVMENLKESGYENIKDQNAILDFDHLVVALQTTAKLHAGSIIMEEKADKSIVEMFPNILDENNYKRNEPNYLRSVLVENAIKIFSALIKEMDDYKQSQRLEEILNRLPLVIRKIYDLVEPSSKYRNVINHGDLWNNNIMFKYDTSDPIKPIDCKLVDFQFSRYVPPAYDVMMLITIATNSNVRVEQLEELLSTYYTTLDNILKKNHINLTKIIPKESFKESCDHYHLAGLIESLMFFHWPPEEIENSPTDMTKKAVRGFHCVEKYRNRMSDMLKQLVELYILTD